ncbi:hypothetical protein [Haloarcula amylovorans]|uniref:hypothetical protein n=1 Tax=Haloarcula amylovorans TaxID=2562280 RepID=UPI001076A04E|nr:hypothetical protein [Halomicroarcula amylolytica]
MPALEALGAIVAGLAGGYLLHQRYSKHASPLQSIIQMALALTWILAALVTIITGFYGAGIIMLALFFYFFLGNYKNVRESDLQTNPRSWRRSLSNFNPFGMENRR